MINKETQKSFKIGTYIRVSTEEQAENPEGSIKNQEERLKDAVRFKNQNGNFGEIVSTFIDAGKSGKDTKRPELQRLLSAVRRAEVNLIMVTELSRLSRSIKDFSEIWEMMQEYCCRFYSLRENFDSTTAAGEMMLYSIANFSQYERRQVGERVSANFASRASRGLYNGGVLPIGYKLMPEKPGFLAVDEEQAQVVKAAFSTFLKEGALPKAAKLLNQQGYKIKRVSEGGFKMRLGHFTADNLYRILKNKSYMGVRTYKENGVVKEAKAVWAPLIDKKTFYEAEVILKKNYRRLKPHSETRYPYLLSGMTYCADCGERLTGKSAWGNGGKIGYYEHAWSTKKMGCLVGKALNCEPKRILAKRVEPAVWGEVQKLISNPFTAKEILGLANEKHKILKSNGETKKLKKSIQALGSQIEVLAERLSVLPKAVTPAPIYKQMERLGELKQTEEKRMRDLEIKTGTFDVPAEIKSYQAFLDGFNKLDGNNPEIKTRIIQKLIHKIEIMHDGFKLHYYAGRSHFEGNPGAAGAKGSRPALVPSTSTNTQNQAAPITWPVTHGISALKFFEKKGSKTIDNGGRSGTRTPDQSVMSRLL